MTLIECFTENHIDNVASCLRLQPRALIFLGSRAQIPLERYKKLFSDRSPATAIDVCDTHGRDFFELRQRLKSLLADLTRCVIDVSGGSEAVIMAVGAVLAELDPQKRRHIRVERYDWQTGVVTDCFSGDTTRAGTVNVTVKELIALHGGCLRGDAYQPPKESRPKDVEGLWSLVRSDPKEWNRAQQLLGQFEKYSSSKTDICLELDQVAGSIREFDVKEPQVRDLLDDLHRRGVICDRSNRYALEYTYTTPLFQYCTRKAGNILEVKTLLEGRAVREGAEAFFHDCIMSVDIDWDGVVHSREEEIPDTHNEIDVVLMHGCVPLFISCKNGDIGEDELYKLHTVATRFGGPCARKMLISTDLDRKSALGDRAFAQRAWDMDIFLVPEAWELTPQQWQEIFRKAVQ